MSTYDQSLPAMLQRFRNSHDYLVLGKPVPHGCAATDFKLAVDTIEALQAQVTATGLIFDTPAPDDRPLTVQVGMVRDWAGIYQRKATELGDTPAGREAASHSQRYRQLANTLAALQAAFDALRAKSARGL